MVFGEDDTTLAVACIDANGERQFVAMFEPPGFNFELDDLVAVQYRIDGEPAQSDQWFHSEGRAYAYFNAAEAFSELLMVAQRRIVVRAFDETVIFSAKGSTGGVGKVRAACGLS